LSVFPYNKFKIKKPHFKVRLVIYLVGTPQNNLIKTNDNVW